MANIERIAFINSFDSTGELNQPTLHFTCTELPTTLSIDFRVGLVGLKPNSRYSLGIMVVPAHLMIKKGEQFKFPDGSSESASLFIDTKDGHLDTGASGQVIVTLSEIRIPAKGLYSVTGVLQDSAEPETELHKNESFFTVELS
ncbi:hypothetical protein [Citrobacter braakii]|uniref:hypothetical protein n=1 Tax=Citrobacter braakii TaxID=57706 RepID=UPI003339B8AC